MACTCSTCVRPWVRGGTLSSALPQEDEVDEPVEVALLPVPLTLLPLKVPLEVEIAPLEVVLPIPVAVQEQRAAVMRGAGRVWQSRGWSRKG